MRSLHQAVEAEISHEKFVLKPFSETAIRVQTEAARESFDFGHITKLIEADQAISAEILKVANSVMYSPSGRVCSIQHALTRIGMNEIVRIAFVASYRTNFLADAPLLRVMLRHLWKHSVLCATATSWAVSQAGTRCETQESFFAGLFHDIGKLVCVVALDNAMRRQRVVHPTASEILAFLTEYHEAYGGQLLHRWNLPESYVIAAQQHHSTLRDRDHKNTLLSSVCFANVIVNTMQVHPEERIENSKDANELLVECYGYKPFEVSKFDELQSVINQTLDNSL